MNYFLTAIDLVKYTILILYSVLVATVKFFIPRKWLMESVTNKIVLITGAGGGLGSALAVKFAKRKCRLVLWDINMEALRSTLEQCREYQSETLISTFKVDVTNRAQVLEVGEKVKTEIGFVDILINNAGVVQSKGILEMDEKSVARTFGVNTISHFWTVQAFLPNMLAKNSGKIVSIASIAGYFGLNKLSDYCASKFAAIGFQESLVNEIRAAGKLGVKCITICPYFIDTDLFKGVKSNFLFSSILNKDYVATMVEEAILTNSNLVIIPRIFYIINILKCLLPFQGALHFLEFGKFNESMDQFSKIK